MSCKQDLGSLISEIEWIVRNHGRRSRESEERLKSCKKLITPCQDESYTMKITLDIFVKLHQMLHNYIGLLNFHGPKSRDFGCPKIPLNEALDVAVRAMISAMQSSAPKQQTPTPICLNCSRTSECRKLRSVNLGNKCDLDKVPEIEEVDRKLQRLKVMTLENVENLEIYIKDVLYAITKLPLTVMTSRLEILSSVVRNTKNKLTSCGHRSAASLMGTQVNPISEIISKFILEYGEMKSKIFPCRKICRFCNSVICPMDRQRNIFCCESARHLNFLWMEWIKQNSLKGVAKWDEDIIVSILDSFKDSSVEGKRCVPGGPCATFCKTAGQRDSRPGGQDGEGDNKKNLREDSKDKQGDEISSKFYQRKRQDVDDRLEHRGPQDSEGKKKITHLGTREKRDTEYSGKESHFAVSQKQVKGKGGETNSRSSKKRSSGERGVTETSDFDKTSRKKGFKKDAGGADLNYQDDSLGVRDRKKDARSGRGDPRNVGDDLHPEKKRRGKSNRKREGEFSDRSDDRGIGNTGEPSGLESLKKGGGGKNGKKIYKESQETDFVTSSERGNGNGAIESGRSERGGFGKNEGDNSPGTKTREKYTDEDGKPSSGEGREVKSGNGTRGDFKNIIQYQLSNELFVKLGWTLLPKDTIMRRVVEFQALLAKPHMNWFENNRIHGKKYYPDQKTIFMNFLEDGSGHVCYPNGQTAIAAQISKKGIHELYKVYAQGGRDAMGVIRPPWLMGVFDSIGHGVVWDENCSVRLTYNQNGGVYVDNPSKVPFSWGWNNFQTFPIHEAVYEDPLPRELPPELIPSREVRNISSKASKQSKSSRPMSSGKLSENRSVLESHESRLVEPVKVMPRKVITPLKPICLKMNKYLSLRIFDRKNINLQFFAGRRCVRIELGTEVDPKVQINSELVDRDDWTAKMTKSRFHMDANETDLNLLSPNSSLLEIAKEFHRGKVEADSRQFMIAKYKPDLISSTFHPSLT